MEQDIVAVAPAADVDKQNNNGKGWKIAAIIAFAVAVVGVGFGIYGMIQVSQKDAQIASLETQLEELEGMDAGEQGQIVPDGYVAVFHGGVGERTYETYIYKDDNGHNNQGFTYINTTSTTKSWGSSEWETVITKRGSFAWTYSAFDIAKENGAYSYVTVSDSNIIYSIEEFRKVFSLR